MIHILSVLIFAVAIVPAVAQSQQDSSKAVEVSIDDIRALVDRVGKGRNLTSGSGTPPEPKSRNRHHEHRDVTSYRRA